MIGSSEATFERWAFQRCPEMEGAEIVAAESAASPNRLMSNHASGTKCRRSGGKRAAVMYPPKPLNAAAAHT
jgi:hypothetical protein